MTLGSGLRVTSELPEWPQVLDGLHMQSTACELYWSFNLRQQMRSRQWEWVKLYINVKRQIEIIFNATGQMRSASGSDRW